MIMQMKFYYHTIVVGGWWLTAVILDTFKANYGGSVIKLVAIWLTLLNPLLYLTVTVTLNGTPASPLNSCVSTGTLVSWNTAIG